MIKSIFMAQTGKYIYYFRPHNRFSLCCINMSIEEIVKIDTFGYICRYLNNITYKHYYTIDDYPHELQKGDTINLKNNNEKIVEIEYQEDGSIIYYLYKIIEVKDDEKSLKEAEEEFKRAQQLDEERKLKEKIEKEIKSKCKECQENIKKKNWFQRLFNL